MVHAMKSGEQNLYHSLHVLEQGHQKIHCRLNRLCPFVCLATFTSPRPSFKTCSSNNQHQVVLIQTLVIEVLFVSGSQVLVSALYNLLLLHSLFIVLNKQMLSKQ